MTNQESGQAIVELTLVAFVVIALAAGIFQVLYVQWHRLRCANFIFEKTHAALTGSALEPLSYRPVSFFVTEQPTGFSGEAHCHGGITERVFLPKLENTNW